MSNKHLDTVFDNWDAMRNVSYRLQRLATSFDDVGNETVADKLWKISEEVMAWADKVRDTHGEKLSDDLNRSKEATANILMAFVGGIDMAKK